MTVVLAITFYFIRLVQHLLNTDYTITGILQIQLLFESFFVNSRVIVGPDAVPVENHWSRDDTAGALPDGACFMST